MATLLVNIQDVCLELGLPVPNAVATNPDETVQQLQALFNRVGNTLLSENNWQALAKEYRFSTIWYEYTGQINTEGQSTITNLSSVAGLTTDFQVTGTGILQDTFVTSASGSTVGISIPSTDTAPAGSTYAFGQVSYAMPSDYDRTINKTQYNKSNRWSVIGPKSAQEWQWIKASYITTGPRMRYRIMGDKFTIWPMPTSTVTLGFEYQSNAWVEGSDGTAKQKTNADDDTFLFPDKLLVLGTKLKYFEIKGFDTTTLYADYQRELSKFKAQDAGADTLSMAPRYPNILLTQNNLPDTGFGNTTS
jgi:hypothetical protein